MFLLYIDWLEEIGLPQYRGSFLEARVDGHVLNLLTIVSSNILIGYHTVEMIASYHTLCSRHSSVKIPKLTACLDEIVDLICLG